jgi:uncharacterized protein (DUF1330 family)
MPAYLVAEVNWTDPAARDRYRASVEETVNAYGGRLFVGPAEAVEGDWHPARLVVIEFESAARAREWYDSSEYRELKQLRIGGSDSRLVLVTSG